MVCANRYVYLMRHGSAEPCRSGTDFSRGLSAAGRQEVLFQMTKFKQSDGIRPDCILASTAKRTRQTAELLSDLFIGTPVFYRETLYLASADRMMETVEQLDNLFRRILIIGHNPGLAEFAFILDCTKQPHLLRPADCISIRIPVSDWREIKTGIGRVQKLFRVRV